MTELTEQQKANIAASKAKEARLIKRVFWQDAEQDDGKVFAGRTWINVHDPEARHYYDENELQINVHTDGAISFFSDGAEHFIYLYPKQIKYLRKALAASAAVLRVKKS